MGFCDWSLVLCDELMRWRRVPWSGSVVGSSKSVAVGVSSSDRSERRSDPVFVFCRLQYRRMSAWWLRFRWLVRGKGIDCPVASARRWASLTNHMALAAFVNTVRIALRDLVQRLDAEILEGESRGVLLTRSLSSSTTGLGRIPTQSCSPPASSTAQVRTSEQT